MRGDRGVVVGNERGNRRVNRGWGVSREREERGQCLW